MSLINFIRENNKIEGIFRAANDPQTIKEIEAYKKFLNADEITVHTLEDFVSTIQPDAKFRRVVGLNVYVGNHSPIPGGHEVEVQLTELLHDMYWLGSYETHIQYENLHPFTDGNGRSGRVLWLKLMGGEAPLGFLHEFYYQTLASKQR